MSCTEFNNGLSLYIPAILSTTTSQFIMDLFYQSGVGKVSRVDFVEKNQVSESGISYKMAFIHFEYWFKNEGSEQMQYQIKTDGQSKIVYNDQMFYWIIMENKHPRTQNELCYERKNIELAKRISVLEDIISEQRISVLEDIISEHDIVFADWLKLLKVIASENPISTKEEAEAEADEEAEDEAEEEAETEEEEAETEEEAEAEADDEEAEAEEEAELSNEAIIAKTVAESVTKEARSLGMRGWWW